MIVPYDARARDHGVRRDAELKRSLLISRARLIVFLAAAACVIWTFAHRAGWWPWAILDAALILAFGVLVAWHARVEQRAAWHQATPATARATPSRLR